jgi:hypothetical protein
MKKLVSTPKVIEKVVEKVTEMKDEIVSDDSNAYDSMLGKEVLVFGVVYIYTGKLVGVNGTAIVLGTPSIVYETGPFTNKIWKDVQKLPTNELVIERANMESMFAVVR